MDSYWVVLIVSLIAHKPVETVHHGHSITPDCHPCNCTSSPRMELTADCSGRGIDSMGELNIPNSTNVLLLQYNNFTKIGDRDFIYYQDLFSLDLSHNSISNVNGRPFGGQYQLRFLNLENNFLSYRSLKHKTSVFQNLRSLKVLKLTNNCPRPGSGCPEEGTGDIYPDALFSPLRSLEALYIDGLPNATFGSGFSSLVKLVNLTLSANNGCCNLYELMNSTFQHLKYIEYLDISNCHTKIIEAGTFIYLQNLKYLDMSSNPSLGLQNFGIATYGLQFSNISILRANHIVKQSCSIIRTDDVMYLSNTSLAELHIDDNKIANIQTGALKLLPKSLVFISARQNKFSYGPYIAELKYLTGLRKIILSGVQFPITASTVQSYTGSLDAFIDKVSDETVDHSKGVDDDVHDVDFRWYPNIGHSQDADSVITLPPRLEAAQSNFTRFTFMIGSLKIKADSLTYVDLSSNLIQFQDGTLNGFENVTYLDLSNNLARKISKDLLRNCSSLEVLNISYNFFGWQLQRKNYSKMFKNLFRLKTLVLAYNEVEEVVGEIFQDLHSLEVLDISNNRMYNFVPDLFNLKNLKHIDCSNNEVMWLQMKIMSDISGVKKVSSDLIFNLSGNPLLCSCLNLPTLRWLLTSGVTPYEMTGYFCILEDTSIRNITDKDDFDNLVNDLDNRCFNVKGLAFGAASCVILTLCVLVCGILYRYRWKLRYMYYGAVLKYTPIQHREKDDGFVYDAFVSYTDEDREFVVNDMCSHLESEANITLNIHQRDFTAGEPIASNIIRAIKRSRKTLLLLSTNFLDSYWCKYELRMAQMESVSSGRDIIIVIMYEPVPVNMIPSDLLNVLHSDTYLPYPRDARSRDVFWRQLAHSIRPSTQNS